jgi:sugar phosphate permease
VLGLVLSGYLAQKLGIRPLFLASAAVLALLSAVGYLMMRGRPATAGASATASQASASAAPE